MTTTLKKLSDMRFAFFGSAPLGIPSLDALTKAGLLPALIITQPDRPAGRGNILTSPPEKDWAAAHGIPVLQPQKIDADFIALMSAGNTHMKDSELSSHDAKWDVFVVTAYGKMLPQALIDIPHKGVVNVHPSLLPRLRGPSPIRSAILNNEKRVGVSIMLIDAHMDHGPILAQKEVPVPQWPMPGIALDTLLAHEGAALLVETLPNYIAGTIVPHAQNHDGATICKFINKEDGFLDLSADGYSNLLKIRAYEGWPGTYTFFTRTDKQIRTQIISAHMEGSHLIIDTVKPEGKSEMPYADFIRSGATPTAPSSKVS